MEAAPPGAYYDDRVARTTLRAEHAMSVALLLIPLGLLLLAVAVGASFWAVDYDQFDDLGHVADRALDEDPPPQGDAP